MTASGYPPDATLPEHLGEPIVRVERLEKYFGTNHVLRGIDLEVRQREAVMIIGYEWFTARTEPRPEHLHTGEIVTFIPPEAFDKEVKVEESTAGRAGYPARLRAL